MKFILALSLAGFAAGIVELTQPNSWALGIPFGAALLGVYFVAKVFSKESAQYDEEQRFRIEIADRGASAVAK